MPKLPFDVAVDRTAVQRYREKGFTAPKKPATEPPSMPKKISAKQFADLGDLQSEYSMWKEYAEDEHATAVYNYTIKKTAYEYEYDKKYLSISGDKITDRKIAVNADKKLHEQLVELQEEEMYVSLLASKIESLTSCLAVISREISRRGIVQHSS